MASGTGNKRMNRAKKTGISLDPVIKVFMTPDEAADTLLHWIQENSLYCLMLKDLAFGRRMSGPVLRQMLLEFDSIWLDTKIFDSNAKNELALAISNRESLQIQLPRLCDGTLIESSIGSLAKKSAQAELWGSLVGPFLGNFLGGMWVHNNSNRESFFADRRFYSSGAADLSKRGFLLIPTSGSNVYFPSEQQRNIFADRQHSKL